MIRRAPVLRTALLVLAATAAGAQTPPHEPVGPQLRPGPASLAGVVRSESGEAVEAGTEIALYALYPDGTPGVGATRTDAAGRFVFEELANDTGIVYLVGARYRGVPYGARVTFGADQTRADVELTVSEPTRDASGLEVREVVLEVQWVGTRLALLEAHRLFNAGDRAILVPEDAREGAQAPFEARLPAGASDFGPAPGGIDDGFEEADGRVRFWGPIYAGEQELRFQYRLPAEGEEVELAKRFPRGADRVLVLVPEGGVTVASEAMTTLEDVEIEGTTYRALEARSLAPGASLPLAVALPETSGDAAALSLTRADFWMELDDTALVVSADQQLEVAPGARLLGSLEEPLLHFELPEGAELVGVGEDARRLGVFPHEDGGLGLTGPLAPGGARVTYRFRLPVGAGAGVELDLRFPREVPSVNVLVADTGVEVASRRLHRRRPFQSGSRIYLHREAFQVRPDERLDVRLRPLSRQGAPRAASLAAVGVLGALAIWFLVAPLRPRPARPPEESEASELSLERRAVLATIRDLDHDYETGKLAEADYRGMRTELRAEAIALLRAEEQGPVADDAARAPAAPARFCPACGQAAEPGWRFCAGCGQELPGRSAAPPA